MLFSKTKIHQLLGKYQTAWSGMCNTQSLWANASQWDSSNVACLDEWDTVIFDFASCCPQLRCKSSDELDTFFHKDIYFNESFSWMQSSAWRQEVEDRTCHSHCHVFQIQTIQENSSSQKWSDTTGAECPQLSLRRVGEGMKKNHWLFLGAFSIL